MKPTKTPAKKGRAKKPVKSSDESDDAGPSNSGKTQRRVAASDSEDTETTTSTRSGRTANKRTQRGAAKRTKPASSGSDEDSAFEERKLFSIHLI